MPLPVLAPAPTGKIRPSKSGKWRAASLILLHALMVAHFVHWIVAGETVTPIEPSESMETLRTGAINAGFIFFSLAILLTLVFGRWVCGWGCHLVAYQDLTLWIFKKLKRRPRPFRSRTLIWIPLLAALYMFVWPVVVRWLYGMPSPRPTLHLQTTGFWDTFPQYGVAILTVVVCGVATIYFLGPKGFCTYACPYGAFFGLVDKLAPARIRVTDACRQCGHCSAVCSSNVDVAREVKLYGKVVDPGCMKCLDCVSVCPTGALYYGWGRPAIFSRGGSDGRTRRFDLSWPQEIFALLIFAAAFLSCRGLYGKFPFLYSIGLAGVVTYLFIKAAELTTSRDVLIQRLRLKVAGRLRPAGKVYALLMIALLALAGHSGLWRYHDYTGHRAFLLSRTEPFRWAYEPERVLPPSNDLARRLREGLAHLDFCERWGLVATIDNLREMAWLHVQLGELDAASRCYQRIIARDADAAGHWVNLAKIETARGELDSARRAYESALALEAVKRASWSRAPGDRPMPASARMRAEWGMFQAHVGEAQQAGETLRRAAEYDPGDVHAHLALAGFCLRIGDVDDARRASLRAITAGPHDSEAVRFMMELIKQPQNFAAAAADYERRLSVGGDNPLLRYALGYALTQEATRIPAGSRRESYEKAAGQYRRALELNPGFHECRADLGAILLVLDDIDGAVREYETVLAARPTNAEAALRLGYLYAGTGRIDRARATLDIALREGDENQRAQATIFMKQIHAASMPAGGTAPRSDRP
jgi:polyferredoxin/Flp pilus assembly protein TadD